MEEYYGFKEVTMTNDEIADFYSNPQENKFSCLTNEYLIVHDSGDASDFFRWDGTRFVRVPYKMINTRYCGKVKPRNPQQQIAIDMLYNQESTVKVLSGRFGTGEILPPRAVMYE